MDHLHVTTDCAHKTKRRLARQYDSGGLFKGTASVGTLSYAVSPTAPNSLVTDGTSTTPWGRKLAMGVIPSSGLVSFIHNGGAATDFTMFYWEQTYADINSGKGWTLGAETAALNTKLLVLAGALCTFKGPPGAPYFLQAGSQSQPTDILVHDAGPDDPSNKNTFGTDTGAQATQA